MLTKSHVKDAKKFSSLSRSRQVEILMGVRLKAHQRDLIDCLSEGSDLETPHGANSKVA